MGTGLVRADAITTGSIAGGFVRVDVAELATAWRACQARPLGIGDFRTLLAAREMIARRRGVDGLRSPMYRVAELARLTDVSERTAAASVRRLVRAGLLTWADHAIGLPAPGRQDGIEVVLRDTIAGGRGPVAVPRRLLRWLARGARPALIATALAALLRCVSRRRSGFRTRGRFKSSWVAEAFGIAERHARAARAELVRLGWLEPEDGDQWSWNKWGRAFRVRLDWRAPRTDRPTLPAGSGCPSSYPDHTPIPSGGNPTPEPAGRGPAGVESREIGAGTGTPPGPGPLPPQPPMIASEGTGPSRPGPSSPPRLRNVAIEDLENTPRTLALFAEAVSLGWVGPSEADRLRFVAAAEHALAIGKTNPAGLFVRLVREKRWGYLTGADEDKANDRIKAHLAGLPGSPSPRVARMVAATGPVRQGPSDAAVVRAVREAAIRAGFYRDPFPEFARRFPDWSRERWDRALTS